MEKRKMKNYKGFMSLITSVVGISLATGFVAGASLQGGPKTELDFLNSANEIRSYIEDAVEDEIEIETIEKEAMKMGKKSGLIVVFLEESNNSRRVSMYLDLSDREYTILSFSIRGIRQH